MSVGVGAGSGNKSCSGEYLFLVSCPGTSKVVGGDGEVGVTTIVRRERGGNSGGADVPRYSAINLVVGGARKNYCPDVGDNSTGIGNRDVINDVNAGDSFGGKDRGSRGDIRERVHTSGNCQTLWSDFLEGAFQGVGLPHREGCIQRQRKARLQIEIFGLGVEGGGRQGAKGIQGCQHRSHCGDM